MPTAKSGSHGTSKRGFASMDEDKQREIASKGGKAAHEKGTAHEFDSEEARKAAESALREAPERFILGADCTVPSSTSWDNLRAVIDTAHAYQRV